MNSGLACLNIFNSFNSFFIFIVDDCLHHFNMMMIFLISSLYVMIKESKKESSIITIYKVNETKKTYNC